MPEFIWRSVLILQASTAIYTAAQFTPAKTYEEWWAYKEAVQGSFVPAHAQKLR